MEYTNAQDHQSVAERNNRTIKATFRVGYHRSGYPTMPKSMIIALAESCATKLNMFPAKHGISNYYSPETIITGRTLDYNKHCQH